MQLDEDSSGFVPKWLQTEMLKEAKPGSLILLVPSSAIFLPQLLRLQIRHESGVSQKSQNRRGGVEEEWLFRISNLSL